MFESRQKFALWSLFGLYGLQNRAFRHACAGWVGNALKSRFSAFLPQKVRHRQRLTISENQNGATAEAAPFLIFNRTAGNRKFILP
jgi:hypothetical protein